MSEIVQRQAKRSKKFILFWFLFMGFVFLVSFNTESFVVPLVGALLGFFSLSALGIANKAEQKGKDWSSFFWLSLLISPLITSLIVNSIQNEPGTLTADSKACPFCAEPIKKEAIKCKHCGSEVP